MATDTMIPDSAVNVSYYSQGLRSRFLLDSTKSYPPATSGHQAAAADISYEADELRYLARVQRRSQLEKLHTEVPSGWPKKLNGPLVWKPTDLSEKDYVYLLTDEDISDIDKALLHFNSLGLSSDQVTKFTYPLAVLSIALEDACKEVYEGRGFVIVRGLNPERYSVEDFATICLGIASYIAERRGRQDNAGSMLMHVMRRNEATSDNNYCADKPFHTDTVTDTLGLVTVNCSRRGGSSILAPAWTVYNELARHRPDLIHVLATPDWAYDTYGRTPAYYKRALLYYHHGKVITSFSRRLLVGHEPLEPRTSGIPNLNEAQAEAIDALHFTAKKYELRTTMVKGDLRFINNMAVMHRREAFEDDENQNRHLIRMWLNNELMCWKLPRDLRLAWARVFEDDERKPHWDLAPRRAEDGTILHVAGSCD